MTERCTARDGDYLTLHTCDDVLACALEHLDPVAPDERDVLLDRVRALVGEARPSKLRDALMRKLLP